jgi:hypothetical protein
MEDVGVLEADVLPAGGCRRRVGDLSMITKVRSPTSRLIRRTKERRAPLPPPGREYPDVPKLPPDCPPRRKLAHRTPPRAKLLHGLPRLLQRHDRRHHPHPIGEPRQRSARRSVGEMPGSQLLLRGGCHSKCHSPQELARLTQGQKPQAERGSGGPATLDRPSDPAYRSTERGPQREETRCAKMSSGTIR